MPLERRIKDEEEVPCLPKRTRPWSVVFFEAQVQGNLDALKDMMAEDFVDHRVFPGQEPGPEGYIRAVAEDRA
jgi:hypothetical protein